MPRLRKNLFETKSLRNLTRSLPLGSPLWGCLKAVYPAVSRPPVLRQIVAFYSMFLGVIADDIGNPIFSHVIIIRSLAVSSATLAAIRATEAEAEVKTEV